MTIRVLFLVANLPVLFGGLLWEWEVPRNGEELTKGLKLLGLKPGPLGYFNSFYMAFTKAEADRFPNLVSYHSMLRRMKIYNITRESQVLLHSNRSRLRRDESSDSGSMDEPTGPSFPVTDPRGPCESKTEGLCDICPATTRLGPDKIPEFINVMVCRGQGSVRGECKNSSVTQTFLQRIGVDEWKTYLQEITICCECALFG